MNKPHMRGKFLTIMISVLTLATLLTAPTEIYHWHLYYPWWWTVNAMGVYVISLVGIIGVYRFRKWGFWLSVGSTFAAPLYLRPNDPTLSTFRGATGYIIVTALIIGLYWYAILRQWRTFK